MEQYHHEKMLALNALDCHILKRLVKQCLINIYIYVYLIYIYIFNIYIYIFFLIYIYIFNINIYIFQKLELQHQSSNMLWVEQTGNMVEDCLVNSFASR